MGPVWSRVVDNVARLGDRTALEVDGIALSYRDLYAEAVRIGATSTGASTAILGHRTVEGYAAVLGTVLRGATYVPLGPSFPAADNVERIAIAACDSLVIDATGLASADAVLAAVPRPLDVLVLASDDEATGLRAAHSRHRVRGRADLDPGDGFVPQRHPTDRPFQIMFTSGSSGRPKAVRSTIGATRAFLDHVLPVYGLGPDDRCSQVFDLAWDPHGHDLWVTWSAGATLVCPTREQQMFPASFVTEARLTVWYAVPSSVLRMQRQRSLEPGQFPRLRHALLCGEALPVDLAAAMQAAAPHATVHNAYGPTEASITCLHYAFDAQQTPGWAENGVVPIGFPHRGTTLLVIGEHGTPVAPGQTGELWIGGLQIADGYQNDPERTAAAFVERDGQRWYRTGDRVRRPVRDDAPMTYLGRVDRQVQIFGSRVELGEVEARLRRYEGVEAVAVVPWPVRGEVVEGLAAFVVGRDVDVRAFRRWAKRSLPTLQVPRHIEALDGLPLNANGKVDRKALVDRLAEPS